MTKEPGAPPAATATGARPKTHHQPGRHAAHRHGNATERGFRRFAERRTGVELTHFFDVWLVKKAKPKSW